MRPSLIVATVQHSGSRTLVRHILRPFYAEDGIERNPRRAVREGGKVLFGHLRNNTLPYIQTHLNAGLPLVCTMRNPEDIWASWYKREKSVDEFVQQMSNLVRVSKAVKFWIPVDAKDRDGYLAALGEYVGENLPADWPKVGEIGGADIDPPPMPEIEGIEELTKQFGYGVRKRRKKAAPVANDNEIELDLDL